MEWIIVGIIIVVLVVNLIVASEMKRIAESKGHSGLRYFHYSFWLGIAGWLIVVALPDLTIRQQVATAQIVTSTPVRTPSAEPANMYTSTTKSVNLPSKETFGKSEIRVKATVEGFPGPKVTIVHNGTFSEEQIEYIKTLVLEDARKYCLDHKVTLITN